MMRNAPRWQTGLRRLGRVCVGVVTWPLLAAVRGTRLACRQAAAGWKHRAVRHGLLGLPALLAAAAAVVLTARAGQASRGELVARYEQQASRAYQDGDYAAAQTHYHRLAVLRDERAETGYRSALTAAALGQHERAAAVMNWLAPLDRQGYAPAHLWQARHLLSGSASSPPLLVAGELHLRRTLQGQPEDFEAHGLLGQLYLASGRPDQAEEHLAKAVEAWPDLRLTLASLYKARGKKDLAQAEGERALRFFRARAEADPANERARLNWAGALISLEDFAGAVPVLEAGLSRTGSPGYRQALAQLYAVWSEAPGQNAGTPRDRLALLEKGFRHVPNSEELLLRLLRLTKATGPGADDVRAAWQRVAAKQNDSAAVQTLLGMEAWDAGNKAEARRHYERALQLTPGLMVAANNLAWDLAHTEPVDRPRALALIDGVVKAAPQELAYRETRGQILARLERWREAQAELEAALPAFANNHDLHRTLAEVYGHLGLPELAADHKRLAEKAAMPPRP